VFFPEKYLQVLCQNTRSSSKISMLAAAAAAATIRETFTLAN
jgi:hypothetical protein